MIIEKLNVEVFRKIRPELIKNNVDFIATYDTIEDIVNVKIKVDSKILISSDNKKIEVLFTYQGYYLHLNRCDYNTITIY